MNRNIMSTSDAYWVCLQPGDATSYNFMFARIQGTAKQFFIGDNQEEVRAPENITDFHFSGWTPDETWMLAFSIIDVSRVAYVTQYQIDNWEQDVWGTQELASQLQVTEYTAKLLLAALSVLTKNHADIAGACQQMIRARNTYLSRV